MEEIDEVFSLFPQERFQQRIDEQIVDVPARRDVSFPQVVEQLGEVPKFPSHDRSLQRAVRRIADVPVPQMEEQFVAVPKIGSQERIQQQTIEQIDDFPVPNGVEELVEVFRVFSKERISESIVEQIVDVPVLQIVEEIVKGGEFDATVAKLGEDLRTECGSLRCTSCRAYYRSAHDLEP